MNTSDPRLLRFALTLDAVATGAMALGLIIAANWLSPFVGISAEFLRNAGLVLLPFTAGLIYFTSRREPSPLATRIIIALNILWVIDSVAVLAVDIVNPTGLGVAFVLVQGFAVAVFAFLQTLGLKAVLK